MRGKHTGKWGWSEWQQSGDCKNKTRQVKTWKKRWAKLQHVSTEERQALPQTDLQRSGDERREPLFKGADSINQNEQQVSEVVPQQSQARPPGETGKTDNIGQNKQKKYWISNMIFSWWSMFKEEMFTG